MIGVPYYSSGKEPLYIRDYGGNNLYFYNSSGKEVMIMSKKQFIQMSEINEKIFFGIDFLPIKVKKEFLYRWEKENKLTLDKFLIAIKEDKDRNFWIDTDSMFNCYDNYILGCIDVKYPSLFKSPRKVLEEIIKEVEEMINFK